MKVGELIKKLEEFDSETKVVMTYSCDNDYRGIDLIRFSPVPNIVVVESSEIPDFDDISVMAQEVYEEHGKHMSQYERKLMEEFLK